MQIFARERERERGGRKKGREKGRLEGRGGGRRDPTNVDFHNRDVEP